MRRKRMLVAVGWLCGCALLTPPVFAQEPAATDANRAAAQDAHRHALELFDHGQHAEALAEFKRAYALAPSYKILYNIGLSQAALGNAAAAVDSFSTYLGEGGERVPADRRQQVESEIARLSKQLGSLSLQVDEEGAEISLDGALFDRGPLSRQLRLGAGRHTVAVRSPDGTLKTQSVTLTAGEEQRLHFEPTTAETKPAASASARSTAPASVDAGPPKREVPWVAWGLTGALGVSATVTGILALSARSDEKDAQKVEGITHDQLQAARDKVEARALATDILLAGTVLAAGVSTYLTLRTPSGSDGQTALIFAPASITLRRTF